MKSRGCDGILITHAHLDHVAGARELEKIFGCPVYVHPDDAPYLLGEKEFFFRGIIGKIAKALEKLFRVTHPENVRNILELKDAEVIHTPGHTPGKAFSIQSQEKLSLTASIFRITAKFFSRKFATPQQVSTVSVLFTIMQTLPGHGKEVDRENIKNKNYLIAGFSKLGLQWQSQHSGFIPT